MAYSDLLNQQALIEGLQGAPAWFKNIQEQAYRVKDDLESYQIKKVSYQDWPLRSKDLVAVEAVQTPLHYSLTDAIQSPKQAARLILAGPDVLLEAVTPQAKDQGLVITTLFQALNHYEDLVKEHLFSLASAQGSQLDAYHTAYLNAGAFIYVPKNVKIEDPIEIELIQDNRYPQAFNPHILIVAEEGAEFTYYERSTSYGDIANPALVTVEVIAKANAKINYVAVDHLGESSTAFYSRLADMGRDARIEWSIGLLNEGNVLNHLKTDLRGIGSEAIVKIVGVSNGSQMQIMDTNVINHGKHSVGHILQHGVTLDAGQLSMNGVGQIEKHAKHADAQQESRILMLTEESRGDVNPILLIEEYEVTAGHAGSVGGVDEEQLYYLMSRGLPRAQAEHMVLRGFLGPVIVQMPSREARDELVYLIDQRLERSLKA